MDERSCGQMGRIVDVGFKEHSTVLHCYKLLFLWKFGFSFGQFPFFHVHLISRCRSHPLVVSKPRNGIYYPPLLNEPFDPLFSSILPVDV